MKYSLIKKVNSNYVLYTINYLFILIINKVTVLPLKYKYIGIPGRNFFYKLLKLDALQIGRIFYIVIRFFVILFLLALDFYLLSLPCLWHLNFYSRSTLLSLAKSV